MKIFFMRHGETDLNREDKLQGRVDCPLNETGIRQAKEAGRRLAEQGLAFDRIYSSPLKRAVDTAIYVTGIAQDNIILDDRLIEIGYGPYESVPFSQLSNDVFAFFNNPEHVPAPEGIEPVSNVLARTGSFLVDLKHSSGADSILVVTHGVAIRAILGHICGDGTKAVWGMPIDNCTLYEIRLNDGVYSKV